MEYNEEFNLSYEEANKLKLMRVAAKEVIIEFLEKHNIKFNNNFIITELEFNK